MFICNFLVYNYILVLHILTECTEGKFFSSLFQNRSIVGWELRFVDHAFVEVVVQTLCNNEATRVLDTASHDWSTPKGHMMLPQL